MKRWLACVFALALAGCPDVELDTNEIVERPVVEFDPAHRIIPFPNNLLIDPDTGRVDLPEGCNESAAQKATRAQLNQLDGFGTFETAISVTFSEPVDPSSLPGNVYLYQRTSDGVALDPSQAARIAVTTIPGTTIRSNALCTAESSVDSVTIVPRVPLEQRSTYVVALTRGVLTPSGEPFIPSSTWALVREAQDPVTVDASGNIVSDLTPLDPRVPEQRVQLLDLDRLWKALAPAVAFLVGTGLDRSDLLLAWEFTTQTVIDPLDPAVEGSPAAAVATGPLVGPTGSGTPISVTALAANRASFPFLVCDTGVAGGPNPVPPEPDNTQCFLKLQLGGGGSCASEAACGAAFAVGTATCAAVGCAAVGDVLAGGLLSKQYQVRAPNPLAEPVCGATGDQVCPSIPGAWDDPLEPDVVDTELIQVFITVPAAPCGVRGCPAVMFGHDLSSSRTAALGIAPQLAAAGFATVAIDFVGHGSRAVRISSDAGQGCAAPTPADQPQCFAPFLSPNLAATRDTIRQSALDLQGLAVALAACDASACGELLVDPEQFAYLGMGLGGMIGSLAAATSPLFRDSVLYATGAGWVDLLENTQTLAIRCGLVDALIDAGILVGDKLDPAAVPPTGLCLGDEWKAQPGYRQFSAIARWMLDPAEPANFARRLAIRRVVLQEVTGDTVIPNTTTATLGALLGLSPQSGDCADSMTPAPSRPLLAAPMTNEWLQYTTVAPGDPLCPPGNTFEHPSLLLPSAGTPGLLGTVRLQTDAITFLVQNR